MSMLITMPTWMCGFCKEIQEGAYLKLPICDKCIEAWRDLVLGKRELTDHRIKNLKGADKNE